MTTDVAALDKEVLTGIMKEITLRNLPHWLEEFENGKTLTGSTSNLKMTYEEFLEWADEDTLAEWVDGEVVMSSPASLQHQDITDFLTSILRLFVEHYHLGIVISAPFQMKLKQGREPDILYISNDHRELLKRTFLQGPADLVVEVTSPESVERDRGTKFLEYEAGGVAEYWLIDPLRRQAECYQLNEQGRYAIAFSGASGIYRASVLPGFWLQIEWLWQDPLPDVARIAWQIIGVKGLRQILSELEQQESERDL